MWVDFLGKSMSQQQVFSFAFIFKCRNSTAATLAHRVPACMNFHSHMKRRAIPPKAAAAVAANGISPWSPSYLFWPHAQGISFFRPSFARLSGRDTTVRTAEKKRSTTDCRRAPTGRKRRGGGGGAEGGRARAAIARKPLKDSLQSPLSWASHRGFRRNLGSLKTSPNRRELRGRIGGGQGGQ